MPFNGLTAHDLYQQFMDPTNEKVLQMAAMPLFASPQLSIPTPDASTGTSSPPTPELTSAFDDAYSSSFDFGSYAIEDTTTTTTMGEDGNAIQGMTPEELLESISTWPIVNPQATTTTTTTAGVCNRCGFQWVEGDKCLICDAADSLALEDWTLIDNANLTLAAPSAMAAEEIEELASYNHLEDAFNAYVAATSTGQQEGAEELQQQQQQQQELVQDNAVDDSSATEASSDEEDARSRLSPLARESYFDGLRIKAPIS